MPIDSSVGTMRKPADLDPAEFDSLNEEFYRAAPANVIESRLWMLVSYLGSSDLEAQWTAADIYLKREAAPGDKDLGAFAALEGMLILHHASEALLRLCLAHWKDAQCPWWEMTRLRQPGAFPKGVRRLAAALDTDEGMAELLRVVSWTGDEAVMAASGTWATEDGWSRHRDGLRELIRACCATVLDGADLYNAGKHGLAILPGESAFKIGDGEMLAESGPSLTVIEQTIVDGQARWSKAIHWAKFQRNMALIALITQAIGSLWECGKQRRVGGGDQHKVAIFDSELVSEAMLMQARTGISTRRMSFILFDAANPMFPAEPGG
jgi:hypothetical protein